LTGLGGGLFLLLLLELLWWLCSLWLPLFLEINNMPKEEKEKWYMGFWSDEEPVDAAKIAIQTYEKKYGKPPTIVLAPRHTDTTPLQGLKCVVQVDPVLFMNNYLIGVVHEEEICVGSEAESEQVCMEG
jgi:hypothetical protein